MIKKNVNIILMLIIALINIAYGEEKSSPNQDTAITSNNESPIDDETNIQKVIEEYKAYLAKIDQPLRDEIVGYRKKIAEINKQKRELYRKLSKEAQDYLKEEQQYKKRLPMNQRKSINIQDQAK